jgi:hypothetical protein
LDQHSAAVLKGPGCVDDHASTQAPKVSRRHLFVVEDCALGATAEVGAQLLQRLRRPPGQDHDNTGLVNQLLDQPPAKNTGRTDDENA